MIQSVFLFATFVTGGWETADSHIVISSACEKSLSFTGKRVMRETRKRETCYPKAFGHRHDLYSAALLIFMHRTTISHFSFNRGFRTHSKDSTPHGLTLNPHRSYDFFNSRRSAIHTIFILLIYVSLYIPECAII